MAGDEGVGVHEVVKGCCREYWEEWMEVLGAVADGESRVEEVGRAVVVMAGTKEWKGV